MAPKASEPVDGRTLGRRFGHHPFAPILYHRPGNGRPKRFVAYESGGRWATFLRASSAMWLGHLFALCDPYDPPPTPENRNSS